MTAIRDSLRTVASRCRAIPGRLGLRTKTVELIVESWTGAVAGEGTRTQTVTLLTEASGQPPKVSAASEKRVALGLADVGEQTIGPLTPVASVPWATLTQSSVADGETAKIRLTHTETGEVVYCRIAHVDTDKPLRVIMRVVPLTE